MRQVNRPEKDRRRSGPIRTPRGWLLLILCCVIPSQAVHAQIPRDQVHLAVSLGGYVKVGIGITHWVEQHHSVEITAYPLAYPWEGLNMELRAGYNWIPSDEAWRAKLGAGASLLIHQPRGAGGWVTPLVSFTPGLNYVPENERCLRVDLPMSYYLTERVFAPTGIDFFYGLRK